MLAALEAAEKAGALRVAVVCVRGSALAALAEHEIAVVVGPEAVAGSTRLKAGTAQKLVLNTISTVTMVRLGRTYAGLMVGVSPENTKLRERARRNLMLASGAAEEDVDAALAAAGNDATVALVSLLAGVDPDARASGSPRPAAPCALALGDRDEAGRRSGARPRRARAGRRRGRRRRVVDVGLGGGARGRIAVPGFVDLQVNGFGGVDFLAAGAATTCAPARRCSRPA